MTKTIKKAISIIIAVAMVMMLGLTSFAADYTISITRSDKDTAKHTYKAYQIFTGDPYDDGTSTKLINLAEGANLNLAALKTQLGLASTATLADVVNELNNISEATAAKKIQASVKETPAPAQEESGTAITTTINVSGTGYYLVTDTIDRNNTAEGGLQGAESAFVLQVVFPDTPVTLSAKTDNPTMDKVIDEGAGVQANTASLGDKVPFKITSKVPDHSRYNRYWFKVTDVLCKGLTFNQADLEIKVGSKTLVADTDYTLTTSTDTSTGKTTIGITFINFKQYAKDSDIIIKYTATLNDKADRTSVGNDNVAKLIFSNDPNHTYSGDEPNDNDVTGETPEKRTVTYTTGIAVQKTDENGKPLPGATFEITGTKLNRVLSHVTTYTASATGTYYKLKNGTYTTDAPATDGSTDSLYESTTIKYAKTETDEIQEKGTAVSITKTTDSTGYVSFEGLAAGTYTITEKEAPDGYKKSDKVYEIVIGSNPTLLVPGWTLTYGTGASSGLPAIDSNALNQTGPILYTFTVQNVKSHDLPITGGMGTTLFYVAGTVLMLAGVSLLIYKKKSVNKG